MPATSGWRPAYLVTALVVAGLLATAALWLFRAGPSSPPRVFINPGAVLEMKTLAIACDKVSVTINREQADYFLAVEQAKDSPYMQLAVFDKDGTMIHVDSGDNPFTVYKAACQIILRHADQIQR